MLYRIFLHLRCAWQRPRNWRWHLAGIRREFVW